VTVVGVLIMVGSWVALGGLYVAFAYSSRAERLRRLIRGERP
jgi:hypothetical protein